MGFMLRRSTRSIPHLTLTEICHQLVQGRSIGERKIQNQPVGWVERM
jgi:hypothetical protein